MKIITSIHNKNIQFVCGNCFSIYEVESKKDWTINMLAVSRMSPNEYKVPEYMVICPVCGCRRFLGFDPDDLIGTKSVNTYCGMIPMLKQRDDWNDRYRVEPIGE